MNSENLAEKQTFYLDKIDRLIRGLEYDHGETRMFKLLRTCLEEAPEIIIEIIEGSITIAKERLNQDRKSGSSASLYYPIETGIRYLANKFNYFAGMKDPFSPASWTPKDILDFMQRHREAVMQISGNKTTAKNLPQRAMAIFWLISQLDLISWQKKRYVFIELGTGLGLILNALSQPKLFARWFKDQPEAATVPKNLLSSLETIESNFPGIGLDLISPDEWSVACISDDKKRTAALDFCRIFSERSHVIVSNALRIDELPELHAFLSQQFKGECVLVIYSCAALYQFAPADRKILEKKVYRILAPYNGYFVKIDIAKYMGRPDLPGNSIGWVEDSRGTRISPKFKFHGEAYEKWEVLTCPE